MRGGPTGSCWRSGGARPGWLTTSAGCSSRRLGAWGGGVTAAPRSAAWRKACPSPSEGFSFCLQDPEHSCKVATVAALKDSTVGRDGGAGTAGA